jgi:hypothetical protein
VIREARGNCFITIGFCVERLNFCFFLKRLRTSVPVTPSLPNGLLKKKTRRNPSSPFSPILPVATIYKRETVGKFQEKCVSLEEIQPQVRLRRSKSGLSIAGPANLNTAQELIEVCFRLIKILRSRVTNYLESAFRSSVVIAVIHK